MKTKMTFKELIAVASMLFGLFFGAGNLIFPVHMGQMAGRNVWMAVIGFIITGVGIPILGVAALGMSRSNGLLDLSSKVGKGYGVFFTCLLYLTIGPFFAIPRCATVPFSMGVEPLVGAGASKIALVIFTVIFFAIVLFFSLKPNGILTWVGKILTPVFLICLGVLVLTALLRPAGSISAINPDEAYAAAGGALLKGFFEGYNTMDAIAGLAFGIIVVNVIKDLGITEPGHIAASTVKAGCVSGLIMAAIYVAITIMGTQSRGVFELTANGSLALADISGYYFGTAGTLVLAAISTLACLKTAIGLITSCSQTFEAMFPKGPKYNVWAMIFVTVSFAIANVGLTTIINYSIPVLMFLYPLAITLIALAMCSKWVKNNKTIYACVTGFTLVAALFDLVNSLPQGAIDSLHLAPMIGFAKSYIPLFGLGFGWVVPALIGLVTAIVINSCRKGARA